MMRHVCAWCRRFIGPNGNPHGFIILETETASHGICGQCARTVFPVA